MAAENTATETETGTHRILIETSTATHEIRLTRGRMTVLAAAAALGLGWTLTATAGFLVSSLGDTGQGAEVGMVEQAYGERIEALDTRLAAATERAREATAKLDAALARIVAQQRMLRTSLDAEDELAAELDAMRTQLVQAVQNRDAAEQRAARLDSRLASLRTDLGDDAAQAGEMEVVLDAMSDMLQSAVRDRDTQREDMTRLRTQITAMKLRMEIAADRQERLIATLEDAVQVSFKPLEKLFEGTGLDVDSLLRKVSSEYSGIGGDGMVIPASLAGGDEPEANARLASLMAGMDRTNMMRIAATKIPFTMPVRQAHRFTSGFGPRNDPKNGSRRAHNGIDLAGPRGTRIEATADGVVTYAGWSSGFGKLVKIQHAFGFETYYAHQDKIRVKVGDRIARGDHIGDMGNTGRSTGVHLHYEVRLGGSPVNPLTYIKAAQDVF
ncbi:peptidoglycan DD-metalloendopeptidase family protein [Rhodobacteraceae bacterium 2CG4]|uniref:Peptidoglycan DD-metalloendopeptidase family protein n=1 Tax=Halovulum marinum TaxID=2662447 RepID=A0A6L5YXL0_9RHOB|nr:DUF5930 domain-containing protein [Halovulum marinum]MSU89073.1 peptidoglycan DD-metalloendopeptidase family protein [Halovulum marinum]